MFKRTLLAASIAASFSGAAVAGTWAPSSGAPDFATEIFGPGSAATVLKPTTAVYTFDATPGGGSAFNVDFTLSGGATFGAALTSSSLAFADVDTGGSAVSITLVDGGGVDDTTARFRVDVSTAISANDTLTLTYDINDAEALASDSASIKLGVTLTDGLGNVDTVGTAGDVATSTEGTAATIGATGAGATIDVTEGSTQFTTNGPSGDLLSAVVATVNLEDNTGPAREDDGTTAWATNAGDALVSSATITVNGPFAASVGVDADDDADTADGVYLDINGNDAYDAGEEADSLTATQAVFELTGAQAATLEAAGAYEIQMIVDGETAIPESEVTGTFDVDWTNATYADTSVEGDGGSFTKNGDSVALDLLLTPGGAFANFVRVSNKSGVDGDVFFTVFNDAGESETISLGDIAGQSTSTLNGQASTSLLSIQSIYDAVVASDSSFDVSGGKLRAIVEGEFGDIEAQAISVATDGTSFSTF